MSNWSIGLHSWILEDGNYADFYTDQERQFALEFYSDNFECSDSKVRSAEFIDRATYLVNAEVSYIDSEMWVLDFGVKAYRERAAHCVPGSEFPDAGIRQETFVSELQVGQFVRATIHLSVDGFDYMESLCQSAGVPPLIYTWKIVAVNKQCGPLIKLAGDANVPQGYLAIDESKAKWHQVENTLTRLEDFQGFNELQCLLLPIAPTADGEPLVKWHQQ